MAATQSLDAVQSQHQTALVSPLLTRRTLYTPIKVSDTAQQQQPMFCLRATRLLGGRDFRIAEATSFRDLVPSQLYHMMDLVNEASFLQGNKQVLARENEAARRLRKATIRITTVFSQAALDRESNPALVPIGYDVLLLTNMGPSPEYVAAATAWATTHPGKVATATLTMSTSTGMPPPPPSRRPLPPSAALAEDLATATATAVSPAEDEAAQLRRVEEQGRAQYSLPPSAPTQGSGAKRARDDDDDDAEEDEDEARPHHRHRRRSRPSKKKKNKKKSRRKRARRDEEEEDDEPREDDGADALVEQLREGEDEEQDDDNDDDTARASLSTTWTRDLALLKGAEDTWVTTTRSKLAAKRKANEALLDQTRPKQYEYLYSAEPRLAWDKFTAPYYERLAGCPPRQATLFADRNQPADVYAAANDHAHSLGELFTQRLEDVQHEAKDPRVYWPLGSLSPLGRVLATHGGGTAATLEDTVPALFQSGAPAPVRYPNQGRFTFDLDLYYAVPEMVMEFPLPFPLGVALPDSPTSAATPAWLYQSDLAAFVRDNALPFFEPLLRTLVPHTMESHLETAGFSEPTAGSGLVAAAAHATYRPLLEDARVVGPDGYLVRWYRLVEKQVRAALTDQRQRFCKDLAYPRWITESPVSLDKAASTAERVQEEVELLNQRVPDATLEDAAHENAAAAALQGSTMAARMAHLEQIEFAPRGDTTEVRELEALRRRIRDHEDAPAATAAAAAGDAGAGEEGGVVEDMATVLKGVGGWLPPTRGPDESERLSSMLRDKALLQHSRAGRWNAPTAVIETDCDMLRLRIINEVRRAEVTREQERRAQEADRAGTTRDYWPDRDLKTRAFIDDLGKQALDVIFNTQRESPAFLQQRNHVKYLIRRAGGAALAGSGSGGLTFGPQPLVNASAFQTMMVWSDSTVRVSFRVAPGTMPLVRLFMMIAACRHTLPPFTEGKPQPNAMLLGPNQSSKSFSGQVMQAVTMPGGVESEAYMSEKSLTGGGHHGFKVVLYHEANRAMLCDPGDANNPTKQGNPLQVALLKTAMTDYALSARILTVDEKTKKRQALATMTYYHCLLVLLVNYDKDAMHIPLLSRMMLMETKLPNSLEPAESVTNYIRHSSLEAGGQLHVLVQQHHLLDAHHMILAHICNAGVFPSDTLDEAAVDVINMVLDKLRGFALRGSGFTPRRRQFVCAFAQVFAQRTASFTLMATDRGHDWLRKKQAELDLASGRPIDDRRMLSPFSWEAIRDFCAPLMVVTLEHLIYALTMLDFLFDPLYEADVLMVLAHRLLQKGEHPGTSLGIPLKVLVNDMQGSDDVLADLGFRPFRAMLPLPPPQPAPLPATATAPAAAVAVQHETVEDYRYLTMPYKTRQQLEEDIRDDIKRYLFYEIRREEVRSILDAIGKERIDAPYLCDTNHHDGVERKLGSNNQPCFDSIQVLMFNKREESGTTAAGANAGNSTAASTPRNTRQQTKTILEIALSREFLRRRVGIGSLVISDAKDMADELAKAGDLPEAERASILLRFGMTPMQRLNEYRTITEETLGGGAFYEIMATCDLARRPMARAIAEVVGNAAFRMTPRGAGLSVDKFLTAYSPNNFYVRLREGGDARAFVSLGCYQQILAIRRAPPSMGGSAKYIVRINSSRAPPGQMQQIRASLGLSATSDALVRDSPLIRQMTSHADMYTHCIDYESAQQRFEALGANISRYWMDAARKIGLDYRLPWHYAPVFNELVQAAAVAHGEHESQNTYPRDGIQEETESAINRYRELHRKRDDRRRLSLIHKVSEYRTCEDYYDMCMSAATGTTAAAEPLDLADDA